MSGVLHLCIVLISIVITVRFELIYSRGKLRKGIMKKTILIIMLVACSFTVSSNTFYGDVHLTHVEPTKEKVTWLREKQVTPRYPISLAKKGIAGCGVFRVVVDEKGKTETISLIQSIPEDIIYQPSRKIIKKWNWVQAKNGQPVAEEKIIRLDYCLGGSSTEEAKAMCVKQSKLNCSG